MKLHYLILLISATVLISCKKDHTCDCHIVYTDGTTEAPQETTVIPNSSKSYAKETCDDHANTWLPAVTDSTKTFDKVDCVLED